MARKKNESKGARELTVKKRQDAMKAKFLTKLHEMPVVQVAAAKTGVDRSTYYRWRNEDPEFAKQADEAQEKGVSYINDMMESLLIKAAQDGKMTAIIFWLKNHSKQYNDKRYHEHEVRLINPLTDERKQEIAEAMMKWSEPDDDEKDEDYDGRE